MLRRSLRLSAPRAARLRKICSSRARRPLSRGQAPIRLRHPTELRALRPPRAGRTLPPRPTPIWRRSACSYRLRALCSSRPWRPVLRRLTTARRGIGRGSRGRPTSRVRASGTGDDQPGLLDEGGRAHFGELAGIRTRDPMIKSHVLYQLSYELSPSRKAVREVRFSRRRGAGVKSRRRRLNSGAGRRPRLCAIDVAIHLRMIADA